MWLAWPPHHNLSPILLVGLVPLLIALSDITNVVTEKTGKRVFLTAGLAFLVWNTACTYWVYNAISAFNGPVVSFFVSLVPYGLGALLMTFAFWLWYQLARRSNKWIGYLGLVCFYIALEFLHESWDLAFPWMTLGNGFATDHRWVQWYSFTGIYGGTLWILLSNIAIFEVYRAFAKSLNNRWVYTATALFIVVAPLVLSNSIYQNYQEKNLPVNVVVVQPNIDPYQKYETVSSRQQLEILTHLSDSVAQPNTEYFIWPETAMPNYADEDRIRDNPDFLVAQNFLAKYKNASLITGIESVKFYNDKKTVSAKENPNGGFYDNFNTAMQLENSANVQFYHKSKLVPGAEKMPFPKVFSFLAPVFSGLGGSASGWGWQDKPSVFYAYSGAGVAPVICYESIWGSWVANAVSDGAQLIAVITNDGWWGNTSGKDQHMLYAKLRAIENRRYVLRSANTGISAVINQRGDVVAKTDWWVRTAIKHDVNLNDEITFYTQNGDFIAQIASLLAFGLAIFIIIKKYNVRKNVKTQL